MLHGRMLQKRGIVTSIIHENLIDPLNPANDYITPAMWARKLNKSEFAE